MDWLNYHHLYYFWVAAREGSIARACDQLDLAQPTVSAQIRTLERSLGAKLFEKRGRGLALTDAGRIAFRYADEIFGIGRELKDALKGRPAGRPLRLVVGVADALPKLVAYRILEPALRLPEPVHMVCLEGKLPGLLADLSVHAVDLVLSDAPIGPEIKVKAYNHSLGSCGLSVLGAAAPAEGREAGFPGSLDGAPFLLPAESTAVRRPLDQWFEAKRVRPDVRGEFEDGALMKVFGQAGVGLFVVPTVVEPEVCRQYGVRLVGRIPEVRERFFAVSVERRLKHPAVVAISEAARQTLFA